METMDKLLKSILMITFLAFGSVGLVGCDDGGFEDAGEEIDDAGEEMGDELE